MDLLRLCSDRSNHKSTDSDYNCQYITYIDNNSVVLCFVFPSLNVLLLLSLYLQICNFKYTKIKNVVKIRKLFT